MLNFIKLFSAILEAQGGKATDTQGNKAGHLSHQANWDTQTSAENCFDPPPTEINTLPMEVYYKDYIEMNLNANSYGYFCILQRLKAGSQPYKHHPAVSKSHVVWEITGFTSVRL